MNPVQNTSPSSNKLPPTTQLSRLWSSIVTSASTTPQLESSLINPSLRVSALTAHFTPTWKKELNQWINEASENERANRQNASQYISKCIIFPKRSLNLSGLQLTSLPPVLQHCNWLQTLDCSNNALSTLILHNMTSLKELVCYHNPSLTSLTLRDLPQFESDDFHADGFETLVELKLINLPKLKLVQCSVKTLNTLEIQNLLAVDTIRCNRTNITYLILNNLPSLNQLFLNNGSLTTLRLNNLTKLMTLECMNNPELKWTDELGDALLQMPILSFLHLKGTKIQWADLPEQIRMKPIYSNIRASQAYDQNFNVPQSISPLDLKNNFEIIVKDAISQAKSLNPISEHIALVEQKLSDFSSAKVTQETIDTLFRAASLITHSDKVKDTQLNSYFIEMSNLKDIFAPQENNESDSS